MTHIRKILFLALCLLLFSCEKDPLTAYDCKIELKGLLCRTYLFENDKGIGYIDYSYNDTLLTGLVYTNNRGVVKRKVAFTYNSQGQLVKELTRNTNGDNESKAYHYSPDNLLSEIIHFKEDELIGTTQYFYDVNHKLIKKEVYRSNELDSLFVYEYDSAGDLWRVSFYDTKGALLQYNIHNFYDNGVERVNKYNPKGVFLSYELFLSNQNGFLQEHTAYNHKLELVEKNIYEYEDENLIKASQYNGLLQLLSYRVLFYS